MTKSDGPTRIWLCDLTYTQQTVASDIMPAAVAGIAEYAACSHKEPLEIQIFKYPAKLIEALETLPPPHILGFSNYVWNSNLSCSFAETAKKHFRDIVTVFGGPNYPSELREQELYLKKHEMIDFYVVGEGEEAFAHLVEQLKSVNFDLTRLPHDLPSIHRIDGLGNFRRGSILERSKDIGLYPSPYLSGRMDPFFDGVLLPIVQTRRGCPFSCTYCVEGGSYYSKISDCSHDKVGKEIRYISRKMSALLKSGMGRTDMHISDSNFGMYKDDLNTARIIGEMQAEYGYPEYVSVTTGKNRKELVLEAARLMNGKLRLTGAVQSLDSQVLENIKRKNIDEHGLMELALEASHIGANSYSEIILALPGDSLNAHIDSIRKVIEANFSYICLYQLMLLPGTHLATEESKREWNMQTRYRVLPRCYGYFDCLGGSIVSAEIEEIVVANNSLQFSDYLACRRLHLIINVFYNDGIFGEVLQLLSDLNLSRFSWIERIYHDESNQEFEGLVQSFLSETRNELWSSYEDVQAFSSSRMNLSRYLSGELGANLIFKYKSLALVHHIESLAALASKALSEYLLEMGYGNAVLLGQDLITLGQMRASNIFRNLDAVGRAHFHYSIECLAGNVNTRAVEKYRLPEPRELCFILTPEQKANIRKYTSLYGDNITGYTRIITKVFVKHLFRVVAEDDGNDGSDHGLSDRSKSDSLAP
ncbi:MAG: hypothetical protein HQL45_12995 [Alphaproteobacteria bacterium]|nr:hypothetical protein [Alphaproteobacteria bacterium]